MTQFQMPVSLYMRAPVVAVAGDQPLHEAHRILAERSISCVPVLDSNGLPIGVLSRTDLLRIGHIENKTRSREVLITLPDEPARTHMHVGVFTVTPDTQVAQAARMLLKHHIHRVFVEDKGLLVGVFSTKEILVAIWDARVPRPIREAMSSPAFTISASESLALAVDRLNKAHVSGLVVVDDDAWPVGTFTQTEALLARDIHTDTPVEEVMSCGLLCFASQTPLYRAAAQAHATRARRVLAVEDRKVVGVLTGLNFARAAA
jgi:CBS domain-containing protein